MAVQIVRAGVVDRHIDDVFDYLADRGHDRAWWPEVVAVEQFVGDGQGPDAVFGLTIRRDRRATAACVECDPPVRLAWREEDGAGNGVRVVYDLASVWTATRVTRTEERVAAGPFARSGRARAVGRGLGALVQALEGRR